MPPLLFPIHPSVAVGSQHACAVDHTLGGAYCWGNNDFCQLGDNVSTCSYESSSRRRDDPVRVQGLLGTKVASVTVGNKHSCAITVNKTLHCWGDNRSGYLGNSNASLSVSAAPVLVSLNAVFNYSLEPHPPLPQSCVDPTPALVHHMGARWLALSALPRSIRQPHVRGA